MQTNLKQAALKKMIREIDKDIRLEFNMTKRAKRLNAQAYIFDNRIVMYRPVFKFTLDSCKRCLLHELAHIYQQQISGYSNHNKEFGNILDMLIEDYGTKTIALANKSKSLQCSSYEYDNKHDL